MKIYKEKYPPYPFCINKRHIHERNDKPYYSYQHNICVFRFSKFQNRSGTFFYCKQRKTSFFVYINVK